MGRADRVCTRRRVRRWTAAAAAPVVATAGVVLGGMRPAGAATATKRTTFTYTSDTTQDDVSCTIEGFFDSTRRATGDWSLDAYVRIADASSPECFDGIAHLRAEHASGPHEDFTGGGSSVEVQTATATEVTRVSYEIYFNGCACNTPLYHAPK